MDEIEIPTYDGKESINKYIRKVERYKNRILEEKYNIILEFFNVWIGTEYNALTDFKNISENILFSNAKNNRSIVRKYSDIFQNRFSVDLSVGIETDSDEINDRYIIYLAMKMLGTIEYSLIKKEIRGKYAYTIKKKNLTK